MAASKSEPDVSLVLPGTDGDRRISLDEGSAWTIGRADENQLVLTDELVSRNHALIQSPNRGEFYLIDMGSRNGSFINGIRVSIPRLLNNGDVIQIGHFKLTFQSRVGHPKPVPGAKVQDLAQTQASFATRLLTVLVVDIRDFTKLTQQIEQKVLCEAIGTWFRKGGLATQEHGSWTQKYIGDAIMSVWVHAGSEPDLLPVFQAYLSLAEITASLSEQFELPFPVRIGAGINTGIALIGNAGTGSLAEFTAMGEAVNAAFRMESAAKQLGCDLVIGSETYQMLHLVPREPYFRSHTVHLKGYDRPANVWAAQVETIRKFVAKASIQGTN